MDSMPNAGGSTNVHLKMRNRSRLAVKVTGWIANGLKSTARRGNRISKERTP